MSPRFPRTIAFGAAALLLAGIGLAPSADAAWNVGGGTFSGTRTPAADPGCFALAGKATGLVLNTVLTGDIGDIVFVGSDCGGTLTVTAYGEGPTGSRIDCAKLTGTGAASAATLDLALTGPCLVNKFNTGPIDFVARTALSPTGHFAGVMQVDTDTDQTLIYGPVTVP